MDVGALTSGCGRFAIALAPGVFLEGRGHV